jgi:hypothetical protein
MTAIKSRILRIWDVAPPGIRVCCIKFAQRIVLAQTSGIDGDVRVGYTSKDGRLDNSAKMYIARRFSRDISFDGAPKSSPHTPEKFGS